MTEMDGVIREHEVQGSLDVIWSHPHGNLVAPCRELSVASCQTSKAATQDDLQRYYLFPSRRCEYGLGAHCERCYVFSYIGDYFLFRVLLQANPCMCSHRFLSLELFKPGCALQVYFATLAEQAERYDEMAEHMKSVGAYGIVDAF